MSPSRMATSSSMSLVDDLLKLVKVVSELGENAVSQKKNCRNLTRLVKLLAPLFEEIMEVQSPLPPIAVIKFQDLRTVFQRAKTVIEECKDGSRVYMIMERREVDQRFAELFAELGRALVGLPLNLLAVSEEIKEQVQLVQLQLNRVKNMEDATEEQLESDIKSLLEENLDGPADAALLDPIIGKLGIISIPDVKQEIRALRKEKEKALADNRQVAVKDIMQAMALLRGLKISLGGWDSDEEGEEKGKGLPKVKASAGGDIAGGGLVPPEDFKCPISLELMRDPVIVSTGMTYDRQYIEQWLKDGHKTCPKTQQVLPHPVLIPNYSLRSLIQSWCETHNVELPKKPSRHHFRSGGSSSAHENAGDNPNNAGDRVAILALKAKLLAGDAESRRFGAEEFRRLAKRSSGNRVGIAEAGVIPLLVGLLNSVDEKTQEHAVTALLNLSIHDPNKTMIVASGAIEPIVEVLRSGSTDARENAAAALFSLSVIDENKIVIGQSGAIPALVDLLRNGTPRGKKDAATALFNLSIYQGNKARAVRAGIVAPLMALLQNRALGMTDEALAILAILSTSLEGRTSIGQAEAVPVLVNIIGTGSPRNKENAASVLLSLCLNGTEHTEAAIQLEAHKTLGVLLRNGTPRAKRKASQLLQHLNDHLPSS